MESGKDTVLTILKGKEGSDMTSSRNSSKPEEAPLELADPATGEKEEEEKKEETEEEKEELVYNALNKILREKRKAYKQSRRLMLAVQMERIAFVCIIGCLIASLTIHRLRHTLFWRLEIWTWCVLALAIFSGRLVAEWWIKILAFLMEKHVLFGQKVLYLVNKLKKNIAVLIWFSLILVAWGVLIEDGVKRSRKTASVLNHVTRGLACWFVGSFLWLAKHLLVEMLISSSHVTRFYDRIRKSVFDQYILDKISKPKEDMEGSSSFSITVEAMVAAIKGSELSTALDKKGKVKEEADRIFKNVHKSDPDYIHEKELLRYMVKRDVDDAIPLFQGATEARKIKDSSFRKWMEEACKDRTSLTNSLNNTKTAIDELDGMLTGVTILAFLIVSLLLMGLVTTKVMLLISSQLVLVAFMFGNTCKTIFEAIIFVFVMHPFDLDDRCLIDGVQVIVEEMKLLTTIFLKYDGEKIIYPNSVLATKPISNFYRSPPMGDSVEFAIDFSTSKQTLDSLKEKIAAYLESMPHRWSKEHTFSVKDIVNVNRMNIGLYVTHTINFQNYGKKISRRSDLLLELKNIFEELDITYHLLPQEVHLRGVDSAPPSTRKVI